jgi:hypothetical protein
VSDPIERIPSMRKPVRQGVPKRKPHDMAKPMAESGKTKDAPSIAPRTAGTPPVPMEPQLPVQPEMPVQPEIPVDPTLALELELAAQPLLEGVSPPIPVVEPEREPEPVVETEAEPALEPEMAAEPEPQMAAETPPHSQPEPEAPAQRPRVTLKQLLAKVDEAFAAFRTAAYQYPAEHMADRLNDDGWTRKQMLAHIAAWHDLTAERLAKMALTGKSVPLERSVDSVNAQAARVAVGKSVGEVLKDTEMTMGRLRRQLLRLTEDQIHADDDWVIHVVASNTYGHYIDHLADLVPPEPPPGTGPRR